MLHGNKFHEEKETVNILKNKLIIESVLVHMLKVIILCNFEGSEADDIVPLKGKIENILFNFQIQLFSVMLIFSQMIVVTFLIIID